VCFEARMCGFVIESMNVSPECLERIRVIFYSKSKSSTPNLEYSISTFLYFLGTISELSVPIGVSGSCHIKNLLEMIEETRQTSLLLALLNRALLLLLPLVDLAVTIFLFPFSSDGNAADPMPLASQFTVLRI
jgi:hypothetical protein